MSNRLIKIAKRLGLLALAYVLVLAGTYAYCELAEPPGIRVDQAARPLLSPAQRAALHPDTRAGLAAYEAGDYTRAHTLWRPRAEAGDAEAMFGIGRLYDRAFGTARDNVAARQWYDKAAAMGHRRAKSALAYFLLEGFGGSPAPKEALSLYGTLADLGYVSAAYNLGRMHDLGIGTAKDPKIAYRWYSEAAKACHAWALVKIGGVYFAGVIAPKNIPHSYMLKVMAELNGDKIRRRSNLYYLLILPPWEYVEARRHAWARHTTTCAQEKPTTLEP